jgi:Ca2+-binding RTX toxin-like protein
LCTGTNGDDNMYGTEGLDSMLAEGGNDVLIGYGGNDGLNGGTGNDQIDGGDGNDLMTGSAGFDKFWGELGNDSYEGGPNNDIMYDQSTSSNDTYFGFQGPSGYDQVYDYGGTGDILDLSTLYRSQVLINWVDTADADVNRDALLLQQNGTTNNMIIFRYFDNKGGTGRGVGALELVKFKDVTYTQFPIPEG